MDQSKEGIADSITIFPLLKLSQAQTHFHGLKQTLEMINVGHCILEELIKI